MGTPITPRDPSSRAMVEARGLASATAMWWRLAGLDLVVAEGTVLGLLGPNGAGKTTVVSILTTLLVADDGWATVAGHDVAGAPDDVRSRIGPSGQCSRRRAPHRL